MSNLCSVITFDNMVRFLVMDVDGTLTDGKIYMGADGELFKAFDVKDGYALKEMLPQMGIEPIIITARESRIVENRCRELGISELHQACRNKFAKLMEILNSYSSKDHTTYTPSNVAYIGDDLLDIFCIEQVNIENGLTACPADAAEEVKRVAKYVCKRNAGSGAVRELVELIQEKWR